VRRSNWAKRNPHQLALEGGYQKTRQAADFGTLVEGVSTVKSQVEGHVKGGGEPGRSPGPAPLLASDGTSQSQHQHFKRKKNVHAWTLNVTTMVQREGIDNTLFIRITPVSNDYETASKAMNSLMTNFLSKEFKAYFCVPEWGSVRGHLHYHFVAIVPWDVGRLQFKHTASTFGKGRNKWNANPRLLAFWSRLRAKLPKYGFYAGHQASPVKTDAYSVSRYLMGYMVKDAVNRDERARGKRLFRASKGFWDKYGVCSHQFSWVDDGGYRRRLRVYCHLMGYTSLEEAKTWLGASFQHRSRDRIGRVSLEDDCTGPFTPWHLRQENQNIMMQNCRPCLTAAYLPDGESVEGWYETRREVVELVEAPF